MKNKKASKEKYSNLHELVKSEEESKNDFPSLFVWICQPEQWTYIKMEKVKSWNNVPEFTGLYDYDYFLKYASYLIVRSNSSWLSIFSVTIVSLSPNRTGNLRESMKVSTRFGLAHLLTRKIDSKKV
jgi:hypothetical protein